MKFNFDLPERRVIIVMPAYNAARTLMSTLHEIPAWCFDKIILVDDGSMDQTVELAKKTGIHVIQHSQNMGYGANQKTCYREALRQNADIVVMLHPDNQYNPKIIPNMVLPIYLGQADVVLASRFIQDPILGGPIVGGMPAYKYVLNRMLSQIQNMLMGTYFSEFHTGYRAFDAKVLAQLDLSPLSNNFLFDNQILAVLVAMRTRFAQVAVETRYFPEASSIGLLEGARYAMGCLGVGWRYLLHRKGMKKWPLLMKALPCGGNCQSVKR